MEKGKIDLVNELDYIESRLADDIQALAYIQDELDKTDNSCIDIDFVRNSSETLLKSMLFNQSEIKKVIRENS